MRSTKRGRGFTLVELLVVISIIGMLVAMLLPAVQAAREAGRRADCMNKQKQWGLAMLSYDSARGKFPGFYGQVAKNAGASSASSGWRYYWGSWMVSVLPYMDRRDLWEQWSTAGYRNAAGLPVNARVFLGESRCPSSPTIESGGETAFSYQVNAGRQNLCSFANYNPSDKDITACGVFDVDVPRDSVAGTDWPEFANKRAVSSNTILDGGSTTLMLSENTREDDWAVYPSQVMTASGFHDFLVDLEGKLGFRIPLVADYDNYAGRGMEYINQSYDNPARGARPASYHPTSVVVTFCDGHQYLLNQDVEVPVFLHLMTSNSKRAAETGYTLEWSFYPLMFANGTDPSAGMSLLDKGDY